MRHYETGVIIAPNLSDEEIEQQIKQMEEVISSLGGNLGREERWGKRKLAYPIKKFTDGYYLFLHYESEADVPAELERRFRQSDQVLRYMTVKKEIVPTRRKKKKAEQQVETEQTTTEATEAEAQAEKGIGRSEGRERGRERWKEDKEKEEEKKKEVV
ncbi:MAG: 30S ribosomal protein S6 [Candidatus Aminicenantales bacterium]